MSEFSEDNPKFIAYVNMLDALVKEGCLNKNPDNENHILIYYDELPKGFISDSPKITEGWLSHNIFDVAKELFHDKEECENLFEALKEKGIEPVFTSLGDFDYLKEIKAEREIE